MNQTEQAEFNLAVHDMRTAQKEYFRVRTTANLSRAKKLEAKVDGLLMKHFGSKQNQQSMF